MLLRPFWSSSPEPPRSTVTSASASLRGRQGFPTSYVTLRSRHLAVSNTEGEEVSQEFLLSPRAGPSPANGSSTCSRRAPSKTLRMASIASVRDEAYPHSFMRRATPGSRPSDKIAWS